MSQERLMNTSGRALWDHGIAAVKSGKANLHQFQNLCALWLRHRGLVYTSLGWYRPEELGEMGAVKTQNGIWALLAEERQRIVSRGGERAIEIYHIAAQANAFFVQRRTANVRFAGLLTASSSQESRRGADWVAYAHQLFGEEAT